jgi:hypothetical protein
MSTSSTSSHLTFVSSPHRSAGASGRCRGEADRREGVVRDEEDCHAEHRLVVTRLSVRPYRLEPRMGPASHRVLR